MKQIFLLSACLILSQCTFFDENPPDPMYLQFDEVSFATKGNQGAPTHKITDIWVYVDGQSLGVFEVPITIPVLSEGNTIDVTVFGGIRNNGIGNDPIQYPFFERVEFSESYTPNEVKSYNLNFQYVDDLVFDFVESFEDPHIFTKDIDQNEETFLELDSNTSASGQGSGKFVISPTDPTIEITSAFKINRSDFAGGYLFLEMDYRNDYEFQVGMFTSQGNFEFSEYKILLNKSEEWNKIYIDFSSELSNNEIDEYRLLIGTSLIDQEEANINIDNLKLIHF